MLYKSKGVTVPTETLIYAAQGATVSDLVLKNGLVLNVFTNEFRRADVAICDGQIVGVGESYHGQTEVDMEGNYLVPGFIDAHVHVESTMLTPANFAAAVLPSGTTTAIADPHEIANVCGRKGIAYMLSEAEVCPMNLYFMLPSCVPATPFDSGGAVLEAEDLCYFRDHPMVLGLGEVMNTAGVLNMDKGIHQKLQAFAGMQIDGHAPMLSDKQLEAYRLAGITTDHECVSGEEAMEKLRAGFAVLIREGSSEHNLEEIVKMILREGLSCQRFCFCTDDKHAADLLREGHIDSHIRKAIALGLDPVEAVKMASWYPAQIYGLSHVGAVAAGYQADIVALSSLLDVQIRAVYRKGKRVEPTLEKIDPPSELCNTVRVRPLTREDLAYSVPADNAPVVELIPHQITTNLVYQRVMRKNGFFQPDGPFRKAAVIERHYAGKCIGLGIVKGLPVRGALASTVAHDSHNLVVIGDNDSDMLLAVRELSRHQGGYTLVQDGRVLATLPLPIGGLMSGESPEEVARLLTKLSHFLGKMELPEGIDPFHTLSFLSLPVIPQVRITDQGLFDSVHMRYLN